MAGEADMEKREALQQLVLGNGIVEEDMRHPERVTEIEMVLDDYCCMGALKYFENLKSVCLIQQAITTITGLESCLHLERLMLNENGIRRVEGLSQCKKLSCLQLCTNAISDLGDGLEGLAQLEVLWIAENRLRHLRGLQHLSNLRELNAARNKLESLFQAFDQNPRLTKLNVSDNRLCSFREVLDLARLPELRELCFSDPDWGENPICTLCNYKTYTLYHLSLLQVHDRMRISDDEHRAARVAYSKKRHYYNMRIKLVKRHAVDALRMARTLADERRGAISRELEAIARVLKRLAASKQVREHNESNAQPLDEDACEPLVAATDIATLEAQLRSKELALADLELLLKRFTQDAKVERDSLIRSLELELQTGGNIRMEQGNLERDTWARQVEELVKTRFRQMAGLTQYGIVGLKVTRVTRVHNRSLRIRLEEILDHDEVDEPREVEYLFYVPQASAGAPLAPGGPGGMAADAAARGTGAAVGVRAAVLAELRAVMEDGPGQLLQRGGADGSSFAGAAPFRGPGGSSHMALTNSVAALEASILAQASSSDVSHALARALDRVPVEVTAPPAAAGVEAATPQQLPTECGGCLLVCSAQLGEQRPDPLPTIGRHSDIRTLRPSPRESAGGVAAEPAPVPDSPRSGASADGCKAPRSPRDRRDVILYRSFIDASNEKVWFLTQPDTVVPEYLVEFDYVFASPWLQEQVMPRMDSAYGMLGGLARDFAMHAKLGAPELKEEQEAASLPSGGKFPQLAQFERLDAYGFAALERMLVASPDSAICRGLRVLNLHGRGLRRLEPGVLDHMASLRVLLLSFNSLESVSSIPRLPTLEELDISFNLLEKVDALGDLPALRQLDFSWNSLLSVDVFTVLARDLPQLEELSFDGNPIAREDQARLKALASLQNLRRLDGCDVDTSEVQLAQVQEVHPPELAEELLMDRSYASSSCQLVGGESATEVPSTPPPSLDWDSDRNRISVLVGLASSGRGAAGPLSCRVAWSGVTRSNWRGFAESLDLRGLGLTKLCDLSGLTKLRRLLLCDNRFGAVDGTALGNACPHLEELSVEANALTTLCGASALTKLRRFDAGSNEITEVLELQRLAKLTVLSLEDNYIDSLDTFSNLPGLEELYLSNNLIEELRAVLALKPLPKLVVLDLSGNGLCSQPDYRWYTMFHLRRLKVLDGVPVSAAEQQEADERFSGKLTMELLEEKLGPVPACYNMRSVDLSNQGLRELGLLLTDEIFPSLRELNIETNPLTEVRSLGPLSKLLVLRMNRTKVDLEKGLLSEDGASGLASLPHVQVLSMGQCSLADMSHLAKLPLHTLRILHLPGNEISKIEGISHFSQLRELVLDRNKIKQFDEESFQGLKFLRELRVEDNGLRSLLHLGPLPRLRNLYLSLNRIAELSELEKLSPLRHVLVINLSQNPVARKPLYRAHLINAVATVRVIDSKEVTEEERERGEQLLQGTDPTRQLGGLFFYSSDGSGGGGADLALKVSVPPLNVDKGLESMGNQRIVRVGPGASAGDAAARMAGVAPGVLMLGQGLGDAGVAGRAAAAIGNPGAGRPPPQPGGRPHSMPRQVNSIVSLPQGGGR